MPYGGRQLECWHKDNVVSDDRFRADQPATAIADKGRRRVCLGQLYRRYWLELRNYIYKTFGAGPPEPEDVVQTAFARLSELRDLESVENPRAFLYATSRNVVLDYKRRLKTRDQYARQQLQEVDRQLDEISPERVSMEREQLQILINTLKQMPEKRRYLLLLSRFDGLGFVEIGRRLGLSESGVRKHVKRALADCMAALDELETDRNRDE